METVSSIMMRPISFPRIPVVVAIALTRCDAEIPWRPPIVNAIFENWSRF
ncbi:hypothetical protein MGH68_00710 [Erysipelothrix sp. D19-032]